MSKFGDWLDERIGSRSALKGALDEKIPGGAKFTYALGSATLLTFLTLAVTGIWELFWYVPSTAGAYNSVNYIRFDVPFGWLIHGTHYWASNVMIVLVGLHLLQVFIWGAFKKPRELTWILGVLLFLATLGSIFTGGPLAWDEQGYWAARVGSGLAGSIPLVGPWIQQVVFGGATVGQLTLSRLFPLHIAIIPIIILAIIGSHLIAFRRGGAAGSIRESPKVGNFWPEQVIMDLVVYAGVLTALVGLSAFLMTPISGPADGLDATYVARPDWPFLWLFQLLKYLGGPLEWVGFVFVPLIVIGLLLAVPWLDRKAERSPAKRPVSMLVFGFILLGILGLGWLGATAAPAPIKANTGAPPPTPASAIESTRPVPGPSIASHTIGGAEHGKGIFLAYCVQCHGTLGKGGVPNPGSADKAVPEINPMDPEISGAEKGKAIDVQFFVDNMDVYLQDGSVPESDPETADPRLKMPSFGNTYALTQAQIADVEAYVLQLNGVQRATIVATGIEPKMYFWWTLGGFAIVVAFSGLALVRRRE